MTSPVDFMNMQMNLKRNQSELSDFMSDLKSWQNDIKQKDEAIKSINSNEESLKFDQTSPPVRNIAADKPKKKKEFQSNGQEKVSQQDKLKLKSYDYRAWDKFDVEKACEEIEKAAAESASTEEVVDEDEEARLEEVKRQREKQKASFYKEQGNKCLKNGKINDAIIYYTKGIDADSSNALLYSNRAMANLKLSNFQLVVDDCAKSIQLDSTYHKSYLRRASALSKLGKIEESKRDLEKVLSLQPDNKEAKVELNKLKLVEENKTGIANANNIVLPVTKPISKRSKIPLKRILIEEVRNERPSNDFIQSNPKADFIRQKHTSASSTTSKVQEIIEELPVLETEKLEHSKLTKSESNSTEITVEAEVVESNKKCTSSSTSNTPILNAVTPKTPTKPTSSMQFLTDVRKIQGFPHVLYDYLKQIDPNSLPKLLPHSAFDAKVLNCFLKVFKSHFVAEKQPKLYPFLSNLTTIKRFSTIAMFLNSEEKGIVSELINFIEINEQVPSEDILKLKKSFSIAM